MKVQSPNQVISKVQLFRAVVSYLFKKFLQIYLFMAALGLHRMQALSSQGERGLLSSCGTQAPELWSRCGSWVQLSQGMWDLPGAGTELVLW